MYVHTIGHPLGVLVPCQAGGGGRVNMKSSEGGQHSCLIIMKGAGLCTLTFA